MPYSNPLNTPSKKPLTALARWEIIVACIVVVGVSLAGLSLAATAKHYSTRLLPNTTISTILVSNLTQEEALEVLRANVPVPVDYTITLAVDDIMVSSDSESVQVVDPYPTLIQELLQENQEGMFVTQGLRVLKSFFLPQSHEVEMVFDSSAARQLISELANRVDIQGELPSAKLAVSNSPTSLEINPGEPGRAVDQDETLKRLNKALKNSEFFTNAAVASNSSPLSESEQAAARERALDFVGQSIAVAAGDYNFTLTDKELITLLQFPTGYSDAKLAEFADTWEKRYNRPSNPAEFSYDRSTLKVTSFVPPRNGLELLRDSALNKLQELLSEIEQSGATDAAEQKKLTLEFVESKPETTLAETNSLGITERIGVGNSEYHGSILTRVHNVGITAERITNQIVRPGEEYSFNQALGEVSSRTGFKPAYVIRAGRTELGDGGGVCQVSSTLFRALLDSGLDITRRLQHSYRVGYYELNSDPGFDATVYSGNVDLRFKNDTENHVLIHIENDSEARSMRVELYGTSDGRRTEIIDYQKWGAVGAPAPEYILDPTLQPGQRVQIDWAVGGLKTKFTHKVYKSDGELLRENTYYSNYRPWSAKYRVGEMPQ